MLERVKAVGAILVTLFTGAILVWWLVLVAQRLNVLPVVNDGNVILDEFQRAKDILTVLLPLFTAAIAYFVGNQGAEKAKEEAAKEKEKSAALLEAAPEDVISRARLLRPAAFE